jgi:hypothetical protein
MNDVVALSLLVLGAALGVVGGWIRPPQNLSARRVVVLFAVLLLAASAVTYVGARLPGAKGAATPAAASTGGGPAGDPPGTVSTGGPAAATTAPTRSPSTPARPAAPAGPVSKGGTGGTARAAATTAAPPSPFVAASRFQRFGGTHGAFTMAASGSQLRITAPESNDSQWGAVLGDHVDCDATTVEFDLRLDPGTVDYFGFAVMPRTTIDNDQPAGDAMLLFQDSDGTFIAELSSFPTPGVGAIGGGSYPVADLRQTRHVLVAEHGSTHTVTVDGTPAGDFADTDISGCGKLAFATWGGVTAHVDKVLIH